MENNSSMQANARQSRFQPIAEPRTVPGISAPAPSHAWRFLVQAMQALCLIGLAILSYFLISHFLLQSVRVVGSSMVPTLHDSESYLLNRWIYRVREPRPADVVVLRDPLDGGFSVKRVVAVAGDTVRIERGVLYVNDRPLHEDYLPTLTFTFVEEEQKSFKCGQNEYFVLGDNRNNSVDSRKYGPVLRQDILGMIIQ